MFESPQTYTWASLLWNFSKFWSNKISAESPLNGTIVKISLAPVSVWGFLFILFFDSCLRLMFLNCFELHSTLRKKPCRGRDKLGRLKYFRLSSEKQILSAYQITFKLEAYTSSFPYKFRMRIKSLVRKRCAKVDSLLTFICCMVNCTLISCRRQTNRRRWLNVKLILCNYIAILWYKYRVIW